jgi:hypothetical protein
VQARLLYEKHKSKALLDVWSTYLKDLRNLTEMLLVGVDFDTWHNSSYATSKSLGPKHCPREDPRGLVLITNLSIIGMLEAKRCAVSKVLKLQH